MEISSEVQSISRVMIKCITGTQICLGEAETRSERQITHSLLHDEWSIRVSLFHTRQMQVGEVIFSIFLEDSSLINSTGHNWRRRGKEQDEDEDEEKVELRERERERERKKQLLRALHLSSLSVCVSHLK